MNTTLEHWAWEQAKASRWFPARSSQMLSFELGGWVHPGLRIAFLDIATPEGPQRFFLPLSYRGPAPVDACEHGTLFLEALRSRAPGFHARVELPPGLPARRYTGEQSNTTIFLGESALVKVFRRVEPGRNIEIELHEALAGTGVAAELLGTWEDGEVDLAIFLEALPQARDGYVLASTFARDRRSFGKHAVALGEALATVHRVLAQQLPTSWAESTELAHGWHTRFAEAVAEAPELDQYREAALAIFNAVPNVPIPIQRIHGDCHLGQVLLSNAAWRYVDFEGEPLKSLAERRMPDSPLRDVAGMLRSFTYAAASGDAPAEWLSQCRASFMQGYGLSDHDSALLAAYEADKAVYEARYETRHRPHLLPIALSFWAKYS